MNRDWQYSTTGQVVPNPADVAHGAQIYDNQYIFVIPFTIYLMCH